MLGDAVTYLSFPGKSHQDNYYSFDRIFTRKSQLKPSIFHCLLGETSQAIGAAGDASLRLALEMSWSCTRLGFLGENVTLVMLPGKKGWRIGGICGRSDTECHLVIASLSSQGLRFVICFVCFGTVCFVEDGFFVREMTVEKYQFHGFKGSWNPSSRGR